MPAPPLPIYRSSPLGVIRPRPECLRVFACDDDLDFAAELASALAASGYEVRTLLDGKTPTEIFELFAPDIVLMDIYMPPPDGFEMVNHIAQSIRHRNISLALISGSDPTVLETAAHFCQGRGITPAAVLQKPVKLNDILRVCRAHKRQPRAAVG